MAIKENDFVEVEFVGTSNGEIFDTNIPDKAKETGMEISAKPLIVCIGQGMLLPALEKALIGKEVGKEFHLHLRPEEAFGKRNPSLVRMVPLNVFKKHNLNPQSGMMFMLDQTLVKIVTVSGGRVLVDFNNPLAGKVVDYDFKAKRKVEDAKEKVDSLVSFFAKAKIDFEIKDKKLTFRAQKTLEPLIEVFKKRFEKILNLEISFEEKKEEN